MSDRQQIRSNERDGYAHRARRRPRRRRPSERAAYAAAYDRDDGARRRRASATSSAPSTGTRLLSSPRSWLFVGPRPRTARRRGRDRGAQRRVVHYYLSGTADEHLAASPAKNLIVAAIDFADELDAADEPRRWRDARATASRSSSGASRTASSPSARTRSSATAEAYDELSAGPRGHGASSRSTARASRGRAQPRHRRRGARILVDDRLRAAADLLDLALAAPPPGQTVSSGAAVAEDRA